MKVMDLRSFVFDDINIKIDMFFTAPQNFFLIGLFITSNLLYLIFLKFAQRKIECLKYLSK